MKKTINIPLVVPVRRHPRVRFLAMVAIVNIGVWSLAHAQGISPRFDVTCSVPVRNFNGDTLAGSNPEASSFGLPSHPGSLVQVILAGPNGKADLPASDGSPSGDDVLFATTVIGQGMAPNLSRSGRYSTSFYPPPPAGVKVYVRVFNAPVLSAATHWGQSGLHTVFCCNVFDASALGLRATTLPVGSDPLVTDSDDDGVSDYDELVSNTNASDEDDYLRTQVLVGPRQFELEGKVGRAYKLMRSTDHLAGDVAWIQVAEVPALSVDQQVILADPEPVPGEQAYYRVEVVSP